jgi:general secretion pathway protein C
MTGRMMGVLFWLVAGLAAISLGIAGGPVVWHVLGQVDTGTPALGAMAAGAPPVAADISAILAFAPFGDATPLAAPAIVAIPATQLGLTLLGLTIANPATASRAIIGGGDQPVASYASGDAITPDVVLADVRTDHVILTVNGAPEALFFTATDGGAAQPLNIGPIIAVGPADPTNPDAVIAYYRDEILQNPQAVLDRLGLQATADGYLIADAADPDVRRAGFQPGDLVTRVNGQAVGDVARDQAYFDDIAASGRATVEVQRAGQTITMTFPLR